MNGGKITVVSLPRCSNKQCLKSRIGKRILTRSIRDSETSIDFVQGPPGSCRERVKRMGGGEWLFLLPGVEPARSVRSKIITITCSNQGVTLTFEPLITVPQISPAGVYGECVTLCYNKIICVQQVNFRRSMSHRYIMFNNWYRPYAYDVTEGRPPALGVKPRHCHVRHRQACSQGGNPCMPHRRAGPPGPAH